MESAEKFASLLFLYSTTLLFSLTDHFYMSSDVIYCSLFNHLGAYSKFDLLRIRFHFEMAFSPGQGKSWSFHGLLVNELVFLDLLSWPC